ncbi:hypothetical protein CEXT_813751 [Caerostris extrusa]|uniref:Uncharacterized protein n=1 Tax=Caerostris extrusa TaxID=172846 RepID=A0AAV4PU05_CAEEX|nr:hypothetical protein CEXT_813751 [Caerostris extrusa]
MVVKKSKKRKVLKPSIFLSNVSIPEMTRICPQKTLFYPLPVLCHPSFLAGMGLPSIVSGRSSVFLWTSIFLQMSAFLWMPVLLRAISSHFGTYFESLSVKYLEKIQDSSVFF